MALIKHNGQNHAAEWVPIADLSPWDKNPRLNDGEPVDRVAESIRRFGFGAPIVARLEDKRIIAGHTRWKAAHKLGLDRVPVRFLDLNDHDARLLALADNRLTELTDWDMPGLMAELGTFSLEDAAMAGWSGDDLEALGKELAAGAVDVVEDEPPSLDEVEAVTRRGDLWQLGKHRLLCADARVGLSTMVGAERAALVWTDPPYGVSYVGKTDDALTIQNDGAEGVRALLDGAFAAVLAVTRPGAVWYVSAAPGPTHVEFAAALGAIGVLRQTLVWVKQSLVLGHSDFHYRHEPIYYGWTPGGSHREPPDRKQDTVWEFDRPTSSREHPTMKPVALVAHAMQMSSAPGDVVLDPFLGSGTTLIAAEQLGRRCFGTEIDPRYCDVIVERWQRLTGQKAERVES